MITTEHLLNEIDRVDGRMMALLGDLNDEQLAVPCEPGINPPVWEVGHAAFFYEYFLLRRLYGVKEIMPGFDPVWDSFEIPHRERWEPGVVPDKTTTLGYYRRVLREVRDRLTNGNSVDDETLYLVQYVIAHQDMHLESLIWCRQTLAYQPPPWTEAKSTAGSGSTAPKPGDADVPGDTYFIGMPPQEAGGKSLNFSFDNERPGFELELAPFRISKTLVSHGEYQEFVDDGGYKNPDYWSFGGNYWLKKSRCSHPAYWEKRDGQWLVRRFNETAPLDPDAPMIHVSYREAEAYARWAGRRLPTEFEWEAAARAHGRRKYPWGDTLSPDLADLDARSLGSSPVTAFPEGASSLGCLQMIGTAWEWTSSQYLPFDGFCVDMYAYMSTLQFGTHQTTRGGSFATSSSLIRNTYRQAYHPDRSDVFTGFRTCAAID